jgi:hypothetical protein
LSQGLAKKTGNTRGKATNAPAPTKPMTISIDVICRQGWENCARTSRSGLSKGTAPDTFLIVGEFTLIARSSQAL